VAYFHLSLDISLCAYTAQFFNLVSSPLRRTLGVGERAGETRESREREREREREGGGRKGGGEGERIERERP
jgi:hypothetical protein